MYCIAIIKRCCGAGAVRSRIFFKWSQSRSRTFLSLNAYIDASRNRSIPYSWREQNGSKIIIHFPDFTQILYVSRICCMDSVSNDRTFLSRKSEDFKSFSRSRPKAVFRIRIWMDPGFFADPDPDFKNQDPEPSVFCFRWGLSFALTN